MTEGMSIIMKYVFRRNEGRNEHHYEIFRRNERRMNEGRNEHHYEIFRRKEE